MNHSVHIYVSILTLAALATTNIAHSQSRPSWPDWIDLSRWSDVSEGYREQFQKCDQHNRFRNVQLPTKVGKRIYYGCSSDKNHVTALRRLEPTTDLPQGAVAFTSKLSVDLDGSHYACTTPGKTDQCPTWLMLEGKDGKAQPVSSDHVPYVVIPIAGPNKELSGEFRELTKVRAGDFGVVVVQDHVIPIIVADGGPFSKLGEGSIALHRELGRELCQTKDGQGRCLTIKRPLSSYPAPVVTVLFPGSRRKDVTPENVVALVRQEGMRLWNRARPTVGR